ncbi:hypothetical protein EV126DRAFT_459177 [Verticillium dahliae]|nr:hypothetical protein EV126DRAFT_459177 [Verticillium dahliae]
MMKIPVATCDTQRRNPTRYNSRYDGDRRSRSPGERSERYERGSQYSDGDRRRSSAETRSASAFQNNREPFRDNIAREPPRGPKALLDPPAGPRGGGHAGDFVGRGRGRGRGRGWGRDGSRDRGRDRDGDFRDRGWDRDEFRDRRDNNYRDDRSRERERDRDWRDGRENFRARRPSPGRGRSPPPPLREFRDREPGLVVEPERSRRGSRDGGPPSAGSSNSDQAFGFGGPFPRGGGFRGRDRGRGWDRGRGGRGGGGGGGGGYYDERDRFGPRSRSQEGRWGRERDERDRVERNDRWADPDARRDPRDEREPPHNGSTEQSDYERRPRSSDAKADQVTSSPDSQARSYQGPEPGEIVTTKSERDHRSPRASMERNLRYGDDYRDAAPFVSNAQRLGDAKPAMKHREPAVPSHAPEVGLASTKGPTPPPPTPPRKETKLRIPVVHFALPPREAQATSSDEPSESDDDEDFGEYFATEIAKEEAELRRLEGLADDVPDHIVARYARASHEAMMKLVAEPEGLVEMLGQPPQEALTPPKEEKAQAAATTEETDPRPVLHSVLPRRASLVDDAMSGKRVETAASSETAVEPQPKTEEMDIDEAGPTVLAPPKVLEPSSEPDATLKDAVQEIVETTEASSEPPQKQPGQPKAVPLPNVPIETIEREKGVPSTPSQVDDEDDDNSTESDELDPMDLDAQRRLETPPIESLPNFECLAWNRDKDFLQSLQSDSTVDAFIAEELDKVSLLKLSEQDAARKAYGERYMDYLNYTLSDDLVATKSREKFVSNIPPPETTSNVPIVPEPTKPEGRASGRRFATELDVERAIQESVKAEEERKEREAIAQKQRFRNEKEAIPPDMYWTDEDRNNEDFVDSSGLMTIDQLVPTWNILPPINNFTAEENEQFERGYLDKPKQWGVIADGVEGRDFKTCILYYYLMKKHLNLKERYKKQPKKRKKAGGRAKTRSSALVSEFGNKDAETEDNQEGGENGERARRPRRAAAPTFDFERPPTDSDNATPAGTPGRRSGKNSDGTEKVDGRKNRRRAKDKEPKAPKAAQALAAAPAAAAAATAAAGPNRGRSRSDSRAQNPEIQQPVPNPPESRLPAQLEAPSTGMQAPFMPVPLQPQQPPVPHERPAPTVPSTISEVMAPPSLRPEPPPPPQPTMPTFDLGQPQPQQPPQSQSLPTSQPQPATERRTHVQPSSYWSVSEGEVFPGLLKAFGSDWHAMAAHMGSKTAVMVKNYYVRQRDSGKVEWERFLQEADKKKNRGEKRPEPPPPPTQTGRKKYDPASATQNRPLASSANREQGLEIAQGKLVENPPVQPPQSQPYGRFAVPIAQAPPAAPQPFAQGPVHVAQQPTAESTNATSLWIPRPRAGAPASPGPKSATATASWPTEAHSWATCT